MGSTSYIANKNGSISQNVEYIAFGEVLFEEHSSSFSSPYLFNGNELDRETNLSYYGAKYLDMKTTLWLSVDPLAHKFPWQSPYCAMDNDPINKIDPTGMSASPIYDQESGDLLGTDDQGLQGNAIVMDKSKFNQGMKHEDAVKAGSTLDKAPVNGEIYDKINNNFKGLPSRPDYDGYLTKAEADAWWKGKSGQPLYVDQSKINLPGVTTQDLGNKNGSSMYKNFVWGLSNTGKVYGTIKLTLLNANTGAVKLGGANYLDEYDYKMDGRFFRNIATWVGRPGSENNGVGFFIHSYGQSKIQVVTPAQIKKAQESMKSMAEGAGY